VSKKTKIFALVAIVGVILTSTIFFITTNEDSPYYVDLNEPGTPRYNYTRGATLYPGEYFEPKFNDITGDYRPDYDISDEQYEWLFGELPEFKEDFFSIAQLIYEGKITDYNRVSEAYWKQPEFYPGWFACINESYINHHPTMWYPQGYGCYPLIKEVQTQKGSTIEVSTYFKTGFGVDSYQGVLVKPYLPETAKSILKTDLFENPSNADDVISVRITNPDDPIYNEFKDDLFYTNVEEQDWFTILHPTHRIITDKYGEYVQYKGFEYDWVQLLNFEITIDNSASSGDYVVAIDIVEPCFEINQEYYFSIEHPYYGNMYFPGGQYFKDGIPHFQVIIHVE